MLSPPDFGRLFSDFRREAFRVELLADYFVPEEIEEFRAYGAGDPPPPPERRGGADWRRLLETGIRAGKRFGRVHVVRSPLTDYLRYECEWGYQLNQPLGEDIRILDLAEASYAGELPPWDFWLFDDAAGVRLHYDAGEGSYLGAELVGADVVPQLGRWRDELTAAALPFSDYWAAHPQYHRDG